MADTEDNAVWVQKGATLSDKTAQKEFGLTQEEIIEAIKTGSYNIVTTHSMAIHA